MFPKPKRLVDRALLDRVARQRCCICMAWPCDPSHVRGRGAGGPDTPWNVVPHCRTHHNEWGSMGYPKFVKHYPKFKSYLERLGWTYGELEGLSHPGLERGSAVGEEPADGLQVP